MIVKRLLGGLLDLVFPPRCVSCHRPGAWLCPSCLALVERIRPPICPLCGEEAGQGERACPRRHHHPQPLDGLRSAAWYVGPLRMAIHHYKYRGLQALADPLSAILIEAWHQWSVPADLLLPVPLHPRRLRERGFNQATVLAQRLGKACGITVDAASLQRTRHTRPQVGLSAQERLTNVENAFAYHGPSLQGCAVCLIDDICTTGATLQACAPALRQAGARSVWAVTLARPRWEAGPPPSTDTRQMAVDICVESRYNGTRPPDRKQHS